jgi:O-acetyl-ADP-ribose deacetylase (regulator of RNase III)
MRVPIEIHVWQGAIADLEVDAVVVPASESLFMTGPIGAAVKRRAGDAVERDAVARGPVAAGSVVVTGGGLLAAPWIIHAVAVGHDLRADRETLDRALRASLEAAVALGSSRIAMAPLGTERGVFGAEDVADALRAAVTDLAAHLGGLESLVVAVGTPSEGRAFRAALEDVRTTA